MSLSGNKMMGLVYEDTPRYDPWIKLLLGGILLLTFVPGIVLLFVDIIGAWIMLGTTLFDGLLFGAILPQRFQIFEDRLRIVLGGPFAFNIPLSDIKEARLASASQTLIYWGLRFATSTRGAVEIVRRRGLSMVISPSNADMFVEQLQQMLALASNPG